MKKAAGIVVIQKKTGETLLGKRNKNGRDGKTWAVFGGKVEKGESAKDAALREFWEETGHKINEPITELMATSDGGFIFVYYLVFVDDTFDIKINDEHSTYEWVKITKVGEIPNLHHGLRKDYKKLLEKIKVQL